MLGAGFFSRWLRALCRDRDRARMRECLKSVAKVWCVIERVKKGAAHGLKTAAVWNNEGEREVWNNLARLLKIRNSRAQCVVVFASVIA